MQHALRAARARVHQFRTQLKGARVRFSEIPLRNPPIIKPIVFSLGVAVGSFAIANELRFRDMEKQISQLTFRGEEKGVLANLPFREHWDALESHQQTIGTIVAINGLVFLAWRIVPEFMNKHFTHRATSNHVYTLITSMFSHHSGAHFLFNMVALWSLGGFIHQQIGRENFLALYFATGVMASCTSHVFSAITKQYNGSLGASGALFGVVGPLYTFFPDLTLQMFFVVPVECSTLIPCLAAFDAIGLFGIWGRILGFQLDHAAHLGGLLVGLLCSKTIFDRQYRNKILTQQYALRKKLMGTA